MPVGPTTSTCSVSYTHLFNQEAHIFYYLGTLLESLGKTKEAANAFEEASVYKAAVSELSMFRALALRKLCLLYTSYVSSIIAMLRSFSSVASFAEISPTIRRPLITMIRSDRPMTSGSSEEIRITAKPSLANSQIML